MRFHNPGSVLVVATVLIALIGWHRVCVPDPASGMPEDQFWAVKFSHTGDTDIVLAGCSRICRGLSPETIKCVVPGARVTNFGFAGLAYEARYFDAIDRVLDQRSKRNVIVLGIAPHNLRDAAAQSNGFLEIEKQNAISIWLARQFGAVAYFTRPYSTLPSEVKTIVTGKRASDPCYRQVFHQDGWTESAKTPEDPTEQVDGFEKLFKQDTASPKLADGLLGQVREWRKRGIRVYGLRVPASPAMRNMENRCGGFNESAFIHRFRKAGGVWIEARAEEYHAYDGSHLRADSAVKLSRLVGRNISGVAANRTK